MTEKTKKKVSCLDEMRHDTDKKRGESTHIYIYIYIICREVHALVSVVHTWVRGGVEVLTQRDGQPLSRGKCISGGISVSGATLHTRRVLSEVLSLVTPCLRCAASCQRCQQQQKP